ncbi:MAG TPA: FAD-dependent monooxygenase [Vicinamibacterales bacterium]
MADSRRILIAGGGIAGLTLALALRRKGLMPELVERRPQWPAIGAGIAIQPNAMRTLSGLGIAGAIEDAGAAIHRWCFADHTGRTLCETDLDDLWSGVGAFVGIARSALHRELLAAAGPFPHRLGVSVTAVARGPGEVTVAFSDGSEGRYAVVVGCDGLDSAVRRSLGGVTLVDGRQMVWRSQALLHRPSQQLEFFIGEGSFFGLCPTGNGWTYGFGNVTQPRVHDPIDGRLARLRSRFAEYGRAVQDYLGALAAAVDDAGIHCSPIEWVAEPSWGEGRVVIIGDAAHATSPMMGQGGCLAIEDACVLADLLHATSDWSNLVPALAARRNPRVTWVRQQSVAAGDGFRQPAAVRNAFLTEHGDRALRARYAPLREPA